MSSSIRQAAAADHARMQRLLRRVLEPGPSQPRWRDELLVLLQAHRSAEEAALEAGVVAAAGPDAEAAEAELARIDGQLAEVVVDLRRPVPFEGLRQVGERFGDLLAAHASTIEQRVLYPLGETVARKQMRLLGGTYISRRDSLVRAAVVEEPPPRRLDLSRAELYELAKRAGIPGRSSLSRSQLISELRRRGA